MINIRRLSHPADAAEYRTAWQWIETQQDLYSHLYESCQRDIAIFIKPGCPSIDLALEADGEMIGFAMFMLRSRSICQFSLVGPPRPQLRKLLEALHLLQQAYFEQLGFAVLYAEPEHRRACKLAEMMGWYKVRDGLYEYTIEDYLKDQASSATNVQETETARTGEIAARADHRDVVHAAT